MTADRVALGRSANARGKRYERQLAEYLRQWWPDAERAVAVGFGFRPGRASTDPGDLRGIPDTIWDCKSRERPVSHAQRASMIHELTFKARTQGFAIAILVERRDRTPVADWIATVCLGHLGKVAAGPFALSSVMAMNADIPVSMRLADLVTLLIRSGVGR